MSDASKRPIIIKKAAKKHHGHHGGAWKVAYADFVTAMMAFFMVLWIMGMDAGAKDLIQGYFQNPIGFKKAYGGGMNPMSSGNAPQNLDLQRLAMLAREAQRIRFTQAVEQIQTRIESMPELAPLQNQIELVITNEGLRIELIESGSRDRFFETGSARMLPPARTAVEVIGNELAKLPNLIVLEGHTDAAQYGSQQYSNWELSVDRANSARRALLASGIGSPRIVEVRGYADRNLRNPADALDPANRRISILLPFNEPTLPQTLPGTSDEPTVPAEAATTH